MPARPRIVAALLACLLAPGLLAFSSRPAAARRPPPGLREAMVLNNSTQTIDRLFASPSTADDWGAQRLGKDRIAPRRSWRLRLGIAPDCLWDLQVGYTDGTIEQARTVNLCRLQQVAFDGSGAVKPDAGEERTISILNRGRLAITEVLLSPAQSQGWGESRIAAPIPPGGQIEAHYRGTCDGDVRIVFANRAAEERPDTDLCAVRRLVVAPGWTTAENLDDSTAFPAAEIRGDAGSPASAPQPHTTGSGVAAQNISRALLLPTPGQCRYALWTGSDNGQQASIKADLCHSQEAVLP